MSLKKKNSIFRTVTFRLTALFVGLFILLSSIVFILFYTLLAPKAGQFVKELLFTKATNFSVLYQKRGIDGLKEAFDIEAEMKGKDEVFHLLLSNQLDILASSDLTSWEKIDFKTDVFENLYEKGEAFKTITVPGKGRKKVYVVLKKMPDGGTLLIGHKFIDMEMLVTQSIKMLYKAIVIMLICGGLLGFFITKKMMDGVNRVTQAATLIGKGNLNCRVPIKNEGEEMDNLTIAFNNMLERIQVLVMELKEIVNNIAHDLRSPITRIRGMAETTLTGRQTLSEYQEMTGNIIEESDNLIGMINTTLEIAETESRNVKISNNRVDINTIVKDAYDLFQPVAENKCINFDIDVPNESLLTSGDISLLQRAIANLIDNAIKYTPDGGKVHLLTKAAGTHIIIEIADTGVGISEKDLPHIFERFYRVDRSRSNPGNGLGLSLANAIIRAHEGEIDVKSFIGKGTTFQIFLPRSSNI